MKKLITEIQTLLSMTQGAETFAAAFTDAKGPDVAARGQSDATDFARDANWADIAAPSTRELATLVQNSNCLDWAVPYGDDPMGGRNFSTRSAFCRVAGPGTVVEHTSIAAGFFLVGSDVDYNDHRHSPLELYLPVSGTAHYWSELSGWHTGAPGNALVHDAWIWHAMQTRDHPVLILWMWHLVDGILGDIPELSNRFGGKVVSTAPSGSH